MAIKQYFLLQVNGSIVGEKFGTPTEAMNKAKKMFAEDNTIESADIYRHDEELVLTIKNKDYKKQ